MSTVFDLKHHASAVIAGAEGQAKERPPLVFKTSGEFAASYVQPDYLVEGIFQRRYLYSLTGATGAGKTAIALRISMCTATGEALGSLEVMQGRVLYLAGENPDDVKARWIAMCELRGLDPCDLPVDWVEGTFNIAERKAELHAKAEAVGGYSLVVIDTAAAFFAFTGKDENSNTELGAFARDVLRTLNALAGGPCIITPCHPVKHATDDNLIPRGGGAFIGEVDGNAIVINRSNVAELYWLGKFRGPDFGPLHFDLKTVTIERLADSRGRMHPTVIADIISGNERQEREKSVERDGDVVVALMADGKARKQADIARELKWLTMAGEPQKSKVSRAVAMLVKDKLLRDGRKGYSLTPKGKLEAEKQQSATT